MAERLLVVADQLPHPPRNGITLPLSHWLVQLARKYELRLVLLRPENQPLDSVARAENERRFGPLIEATVVRQSRGVRVLEELRGDGMYQHGWRADDVHELLALDAGWRSAPVLVSPISALAKWRAVRVAAPALTPRATVAAVHDCTAAEYRWRYRSPQPGVWGRVKAWSHHLRAPLVARAEGALLAGADRVLVQTVADLAALRDLVGPATAARGLVVPNGVRAELFDVAAAPLSGSTVLFVAELSGEYGATTEWLCQRVWPAVRANVPEARLCIVGRGASAALRARIAATAGVEHVEFVVDLAPVYAQCSVVWSPLWKGFGLINKTLEAMAAARPVVGGRAAFNGIDGFVDGRHGVGLATAMAAAMAEATVSLLLDGARARSIGAAARELVHVAFRWESAAERIQEALSAAHPASLALPAPSLELTLR